jgi:L-rhamnose mutarotase
MPLALSDPRWNELRSSYGDTDDVIDWLTEAQEKGGLSRERLGDLINEVQHQGDTSTAMYAVATHLIFLAQRATPEDALTFLIHAGIIYANSEAPGAVSCPAFLQEDFTASSSNGAKMLAPLLPLAKDFDAYKWAVAGLAGFIGHRSFARLLDGLDLYEGRFYHSLLDGPFPREVAVNKNWSERHSLATRPIRQAFTMKLKSGFAAEYKKRHDELWPEMAGALRAAGISDFSIFLDEETLTLFAVQKLSDNNTAAILSKSPIVRKWWDSMAPLMEVLPDNEPVSKPLKEVFHLD